MVVLDERWRGRLVARVSADGRPLRPASEAPITIDVDSEGRLSEMLTR